MSERPTPITDAYIGDFNDDDMTEGEIAMCEFARNLERQLAEAREEIGRIRKFATVNGVAELERQLAESKSQLAIADEQLALERGALAEAREEIERLKARIEDMEDEALELNEQLDTL